MKNILRMLFANKEKPQERLYRIYTKTKSYFETYANSASVEYFNNGQRNVELFLDGKLVASICDFEALIEVEDK